MTEYKLTPNPLPHIHPFTVLAASDELIFVTGLGGFDDKGEISDDLIDQTRTAINVMSGLLQGADSSLSEIVYLRMLVSKREYAPQMNDTFAEMLPQPLPTVASLVICELADPRMKMEIEAIAHRGAKLTLAV